MTENSRHLAAVAGDSSFGPYAFHLEGHVTRDPQFLEASEHRKAMTRFGLGIRGNAWELMGRACGADFSDRRETPFLEVAAFGVTAERAARLVKKGAYVMLSGRLSVNAYTGKDGQERESVQLTLSHFVMLREDTDPPSACGVMRVRDGASAPMACGVCAKITSVGDLQTTAAGKEYLHLGVRSSVALDQVLALAERTWSRDAAYSRFRGSVTLWGAFARVMADRLEPGMTVCVTGPLTTSGTDGRVYYNISANALRIKGAVRGTDPDAAAGKEQQEEKENGQEADVPDGAFEDGESYVLPF